MNFGLSSRYGFARYLFLGSVLSTVVIAVAGCAGGGGGSTGGTPAGPAPDPSTHVYLTGNWSIQPTAIVGALPFTSLAGFINEQGTNPGVNDLTTAALQSQSTTCYANTTTVPLQGAAMGAQLALISFSVDGQLLTLTATENATATHLTGNYTISGGCGDGASGTLVGTKYAPVNGVYAGSLAGSSPAQTLRLTLSQFSQGTGSGTFLTSGSAVFTGFPCFTKGTLPSTGGSVVGGSFVFTFATDDVSGAQLTLTGTLDAVADALTVKSAVVSGGSCAGSIGGATLTLQ